MSKKQQIKQEKYEYQKEVEKNSEEVENLEMPKIPKETMEKLEKIKVKIEKFKDKVIEKFEDNIIGVALLPPPKQKSEQEMSPEEKEMIGKINILVLVDDTDSKKMSKDELKEKVSLAIEQIAKEIDKELLPKTLLLSEVWQSCYDGKYDVLQLIAVSAPVHDKGLLSAIKIAELHKTMTIKKFEKYIVAYVLFGSLTRGEATAESDIDVAIIVDDTDVKKMSRTELRDKLRAIIIGMGIEAGEMTGIKNKLNIQVYILTDFWDSVKEANPVIFTVLRDGIPLYDRGIFMPWKQLLQMGKIKPSPEAIDMFMSTGEQVISRVRTRLREIIESDIYWATLTPSQAAIMLYGLPPPTPKETIEILEEIFVKKEKLLEKEYVEIMRKIRKYYKDFEHGRQEISGKEVDELITDAEKYLKRIKTLFSQIEKIKDEEAMLELYDTVISICRDVLKYEGLEKIKENEISKLMKELLVETGKIAQNNMRQLEAVLEAKAAYDRKELSKIDIIKVQKEARAFIRAMVDYLQRKRGREIERAKIRLKYANKYGEIILLDNKAYITLDLEDQEHSLRKAELDKDGNLKNIQEAKLEEMEKDLANLVIPPKVFIKERLFEHLKQLFGKDIEILVNQ